MMMMMIKTTIIIIIIMQSCQYYCFCCILDRINEGLVSKREFFKKHYKSYFQNCVCVYIYIYCIIIYCQIISQPDQLIMPQYSSKRPVRKTKGPAILSAHVSYVHLM